MNEKVPALRPETDESRLNPLLAGRWSSRALDADETVTKEVVTGVLEAARWAPSAANNQPWRIMAFGPDEPEARKTARETLNTGNSWALSAPWLFFILSRNDRPGSGKVNGRADYEAGMAAVSMALQAASEGLVFHQMAGFDSDKLRHLFEVPENFTIIAAAALGQRGEVNNVPENKREAETAPRIRKPLNEIVFFNGSVPGE